MIQIAFWLHDLRKLLTQYLAVGITLVLVGLLYAILSQFWLKSRVVLLLCMGLGFVASQSVWTLVANLMERELARGYRVEREVDRRLAVEFAYVDSEGI